jgi:hypothetical protein
VRECRAFRWQDRHTLALDHAKSRSCVILADSSLYSAIRWSIILFSEKAPPALGQTTLSTYHDYEQTN